MDDRYILGLILGGDLGTWLARGIGRSTSGRIGTVTADENQPAPRLTVALTDPDLRRKLLEALEETEFEVEQLTSGDSARELLQDTASDLLVLRRRHLPKNALEVIEEIAAGDDPPEIVIVSQGESDSERADLVAAGAAQVIDPGQSAGELSLAFDALEKSCAASPSDDSQADPHLADFLSRSPYMRRFLDLVRKVADTDSSLLITGETGVGKEHLARAIHAESSRSGQPFVAVNCAALPETLIESELFGHQKGAFTGASEDRAGHFEAASGGTIFLDEVGETPPAVQVKLLNVLQRREVQRLGAATTTPVDVRVMAATNRDVEKEVRDGKFREDLYYRLSVVPMRVPSLRERAEDIPELAGYLIRHFRQTLVGDRPERISEAALEALVAYPWPGNVREFINVIERAMLLADGRVIDVDSLALTAKSGPATSDATAVWTADEWKDLTIKEVRDQAVARAERSYLDLVLRDTGGVMADTAKRAGISPRALYDRMRRHGLDKQDYRD